MGWHVTAVFAPLAAGDVPVQGQVAMPVRGGVGPALRPAPRPGAVGDLVAGDQQRAEPGTDGKNSFGQLATAKNGPEKNRGTISACPSTSMMIVRLQIFMVSPRVVSSDPYYLEFPGSLFLLP